MALKFYWANVLTGGGTGALDKIPTANWLDKYGAIVVESGYLYAYECDDDLTGTESSPWLIKPDDETGDLRLNLLGAVFEDVKASLVKLYDTSPSNTLSLKWNEASAADYVLNLAVGGASRTLTLNENLTIGDGTNITITGVTAARTITLNENFTVGNGTDITITGVTAARTFTMNENFTIGNGYDGTLTFSAASKVLTVDESETTSNYHTDARGDARYYTETELSNQTAGSEGSKLVGFHSHTLHDHLLHLTNKGVMEGCVVSDAGTLDITWTSGMIWDSANEVTMTIASGSGTCSNNLVNYLYSDYSTSTTVLQLSTTFPTETDMVLVAIIWCQDGDIWQLEHSDWMNLQLADLHLASLGLFPSWVVSGMIVSEDENADNTLDVTMAAGVLYHGNHHRETIAQVDTRTTALVRHFHVDSAWDSETNAEIDTAWYDNGADKADATGGKWFKAVFLYTEGKLHWVYPRVQYSTRAQANAAPIPAIPPGLARAAYLTAIVYGTDDSDFTTTDWIDIRVGLAEAIASAPVTDHGYLAGLEHDDHTQYILKSLFDADTFLYATDNDTPVATSPANVMAALSGHAGATFDFNSQALTSVGTIGCGFITSTGIGVGVAGAGNRGLYVLDATLETTVPYWGVDVGVTKTGGVTDTSDALVAGRFTMTLNQSGGIMGHVRGLQGNVQLIDGQVGDAGNSRDMQGLRFVANLDAGKVYGNVYGAYVGVDLEPGVTEITEDVYGIFIDVDDDSNSSTGCTGAAYMLYLNEKSRIDYGIYQVGTAPHYLQGKVGMGTGVTVPAAQLHVDQSVNNAAIPVLILDQADVSEEMMEFISTIGVGNAIEAIGTKELTTTHFIKVTLPGPLTRYIPCGTIATP